MTQTISLQVRQGSLVNRIWNFDSHDACIIGRHGKCQICLPSDEAHKTVSRHHALLEINPQSTPPLARIRDFGSRNGTYVNGEKIGARAKNSSPEDGRKQTFPERDLKDGDLIRVGDTTFQITMPIVSTPGTLLPQKPLSGVSDFLDKLLEEAPQQFPVASPLGSHFPDIGGYRIERELGRGGMGAVYLAQRGDEAPVALKVMLPRTATNERAQKQFMREIEISCALNHPNVVPLLDMGQEGEAFFFTLELCEEGSLSDYFGNRSAPPNVVESFYIALEVLDGLEYLANVPIQARLADGTMKNATGIVHRDLSLQNVLLKRSDDGELVAKISDVGLGKAFEAAGLSGLTMTGHAAGKPIWMPRQQLSNYRFAKPEVDIWAAAAMLYFLLSGYAPRDFPDEDNSWSVVLNNMVVPIRDRIPECPEPIALVIDRALDDSQSLHYQHARDLSADLLSAFEASGLNS